VADHRSSDGWLPDWAVPWIAGLFMFALFTLSLAGLAVAVFFFFRA
jgi:hypothetical protein